MCCKSADTYVRLIVWYQIPTKGLPPTECDLKGGHVTLQAKHEGKLVHLGWWPSYWNLRRDDQNSVEADKSNGIFWTALKWCKEWLLPHSGKRTKHATKNEVAIELDPQLIDSIMVKSPRLTAKSPTPPLATIEETLPSAEYYLCLPNIKAVIDCAQEFNETEHIYHVLLNNCSSVIARVLRRGGVKFPWYFIMSPRALEDFCRRNLVCHSGK